MGARFVVLVEVAEPTPRDRVARVSVIESANHFNWIGKNYELFVGPDLTYQNRVNIAPIAPSDLSSFWRRSFNISIGTERGKKNRTVVFFDGPTFEYARGTRPLRVVCGRIVIEDVAGRRVSVTYTFRLGLDPNRPVRSSRSPNPQCDELHGGSRGQDRHLPGTAATVTLRQSPGSGRSGRRGRRRRVGYRLGLLPLAPG